MAFPPGLARDGDTPSSDDATKWPQIDHHARTERQRRRTRLEAEAGAETQEACCPGVSHTYFFCLPKRKGFWSPSTSMLRLTIQGLGMEVRCWQDAASVCRLDTVFNSIARVYMLRREEDPQWSHCKHYTAVWKILFCIFLA